MRIALISGSTYACPPAGYGSEVTTWWLAGELAALGHEVHLFGPGGSTPPRGVHLHYIRGAYGRVSRAADGDPWDWYEPLLRSCAVVHDLSPTCATYERAYVDWPGAPLLFTRNGVAFTSPRLPSPARNGVVLSEAAREAARLGRSAWAGTAYAEWDIPPGRLADARVVHYGVDLDFFAPAPAFEHDPFLLYVGRPHPSKGVGRLIEVARRMPGQPFVFAWRPAAPDHVEWDRRYRDQAAGLPNVQFVELPEVFHHEEKCELYRRAKALVTLPVYLEAFGLTTIEALACGCPVIATAKGAAPEILRPGLTGYLVDPAEDECDSVERAIDEAGWLDRAACRSDAVERWGARRMAEDYARLYDEVAGGGRWG